MFMLPRAITLVLAALLLAAADAPPDSGLVAQRGEVRGKINEAAELGRQIAAELRSP